MSELNHPSVQDCAFSMWHVQAFLHGGLDEAEADEIRQHLMLCEQCLDFYDSETLITELVQRCCRDTQQPAPPTLRVRVTNLHVVS